MEAEAVVQGRGVPGGAGAFRAGEVQAGRGAQVRGVPGGAGAFRSKRIPTRRMTKQATTATTAAGQPRRPSSAATTVIRAPTRAGIAYSPLLSTVGTRPMSTSRIVPPPTPV